MATGEGKPFWIAIDGTAGAGKTTIGQMLAAELKMPYLDTGAMYRAVTLLALRRSVAVTNAEGLAAIARTLNFTSRDATLEEAQDGRQYTVLVDGEDVSQALRSAEVEANVSPVAAVPQVRAELVARQREIAKAGNIIMMGRDIGSVVLPDADLKVYLDASPAVRAQRRSKQEKAHENGKVHSPADARRDLEQRDKIDSSRPVSPLKIAPGALVIHTDHLSQQEVLHEIKKALATVVKQA